MREIAVILPGAGSGKRFGAGVPKQFQSLGGRPIIDRTVGFFHAIREVAQIILAVPESRVASLQRYLNNWPAPPEILVVAGGATRQDSVGNAIRRVSGKCRWLAVHDLVRPLIDKRLFAALMREVRRSGAAVPGLPVVDTLKRIDDNGLVTETVPREALVMVQTPQVFRREVLEEAYRNATAQSFQGTDEAMLVERIGHPICIVPGSRRNVKITLPEDLEWAEYHLMLQARKAE
jgi:2-C-methyl-D-erythritol 4-phosphate cytidylyltransferase